MDYLHTSSLCHYTLMYVAAKTEFKLCWPFTLQPDIYRLCQCVAFTTNLSFPLAGCPDTGPQVEATPQILPGSASVTWQPAQTDDPMLSDITYDVYSQCGSDNSSYQLVATGIEGLSYTLTNLPAPSQCVLGVVAYHRYCQTVHQFQMGEFSSETQSFTTAIAGKTKNKLLSQTHCNELIMFILVRLLDDH